MNQHSLAHQPVVRVKAILRGEESVVRADETLHFPANALQSFTNAAGGNARLLCLCALAGQEDFFAQVGVPVGDADHAAAPSLARRRRPPPTKPPRNRPPNTGPR